MTTTTLLIAVPITILILILIAKYWQELAFIGSIIYAVWTAAWMSLASTILWAIFVTGSADHWKTTYVYFFILWIGAMVVMYSIITDVLQMLGNMFRNLFR